MKKKIVALLMCIMLVGVSMPFVTLAEENTEQEESRAEEHEESEETSHEDSHGDSEESSSGEDSQDSSQDDSYNEDGAGDYESSESDSAAGSAEDNNVPADSIDNSIIDYNTVDDSVINDPVADDISVEPMEEIQAEENISVEEELPVIEEQTEEYPILDETTVIEDFSVGSILEPFALQEDVVAPSVADGSWQGYPLSYHYNWDNSSNCWYYGVWYNGQCYTTPVGSYDSNVRHAIGLYSDGQNIHLYIKYALDYGSRVNGDEFKFSVDGQEASYRLIFDDDGSTITGANRAPGVYQLDLRNADGSMSGTTTGFVGQLNVHENNENDELELIIPLELLKQQNPSINLDTYSTISYFNPNLMYQSQTCAGAGNSPAPFALGSAALFVASLIFKRRFLFL